MDCSADQTLGKRVTAAQTATDDDRRCGTCDQPCVLSGVTCTACVPASGGEEGSGDRSNWRCLAHSCRCPERHVRILVRWPTLMKIVEKL